MNIISHRTFDKDYRRRTAKESQWFRERTVLFIENQFDSLLDNHALTGEWEGYRSINISGNLRAIFKPLEEDAVIFVRFGTHAELYGK